ncbi:hypothetical protein SBI_05908 [Streptomyces bingchenggensis BCW-1]|uniref:Uncharacterized protein n=1 Tax=Streptomyces bingchenggensis (strain BCW-1) TaxID=749414 RepID=D7CGC4_STRBB|nr:hypothetical protein SBI_05908 [Streptomyces bingchenggensis BCW-1]
MVHESVAARPSLRRMPPLYWLTGLPPAQALVESRVLAEGPDAVADLIGVASHIESGDLRPPAVVAQQCGQD